MKQPESSDVYRHALATLHELRRAGFEAYFAGGCVRDMLMGRPAKDFDIATSARPEEVQSLFPRTVATGKAFGVIQVCSEHVACEVATFRRDLAYLDGRHPAGIEFCGAEQDAARRDFTINGLFLDPETERVIDFVGGRDDIARRVIRAIGNPADRFREDYLRMLRAVRFAGTLEFTLDGPTAAAIAELAPHVADVSAERIQNELSRLLLEAPAPGNGILLLRETGLLRIILPEIERLAGQEQPPAFHPEGDVLTHTAKMLNAMTERSPTLVYAVLLHDVGKPETARSVTQADGSDRIRFDGHAKTGAETAERILKRLRMPNRLTEDVVFCVRNHMRFMDVRQMRQSTLRKLVGAATFPVELELHRLDCVCSHGDVSNYTFLRAFSEQLRSEPVLPAPWVNGHDMIAIGIPEGPEIGKWLKRAYELQLDGQAADRESLLELLRKSLSEVDGKT
jgi:poly(A) polymerase